MSQPIVMFVDDSETALASTKIATQNLPIDVKQYISAGDALADINAGIIPNLIITDLNMPVMNGLEFLAALRKLAATQKNTCAYAHN
jgi:two-component system chemotaxis response regulator CheY